MGILRQFYGFILQELKRYSILNLSAQLSYRILLAFIPFIMLCYNLINWLTSGLDDHIFKGLNMIFPGFFDALLITATNNASGPQTSLWANLVFGFFLFYASVCAVRALILTMNKLLEIPEQRNYFLIWGISILYLILLVVLAATIFYLYIFTQKIAALLFEFLHLSAIFIGFWKSFSLIYILAMIILLSTALYMYAPAKKLSFFCALPGGVFVSLSWLLIAIFYGIFSKIRLQSNAAFSIIEGPFSVIIVIYLFSFVLTLGSVINLFLIRKAEVHYHEK